MYVFLVNYCERESGFFISLYKKNKKSRMNDKVHGYAASFIHYSHFLPGACLNNGMNRNEEQIK